MRRLLAISWLALLIGGCGSDSDSPTDPQIQPDASVVVDTDGGVLEYGDEFSLVIPLGAVSDETTLELYLEDTEPVAGITVANVYRIDGLPGDLAEPLTCRLQVQTRADSLYGLLGMESWAKSPQEMLVTWSATACTDSSGWVIFEWPAAEPGRSVEETPGAARVSAAASIAVYDTRPGHFRIAWSPRFTTLANVMRLGTDLEGALTYYTDLGFTQTGFSRWPVSVIIKPMTKAYGYWAPNPWRLGGYLAFDSGMLADETETRVTAAHETLHFCQYFYDPRSVLGRALSDGRMVWLEEATAVWAEGIFVTDPSYCSTARSGRELTALDGIVTPKGDNNLARHGYGLSSLIKHIAVDEGVPFVLTAFQNIAAGQHPVAALNAAVDTPLPSRWRDFNEELIRGEIYEDVTLEKVLAYPAMPLLHAASDADTTGNTGMAYPDLSGQTHPITWAAGYTFPHDAQLHVWCDGGEHSVSVFGFKAPDTRDLLGHAYGQVVLSNLPNLQATYDQLVVLVANQAMNAPNYTDTAELWLRARVRTPVIPDYDYDHGKILIRYEADWSNGSHILYQDMTFVEVEGSFTGTQFSATWDSIGPGDVHYSGHVTATFSAQDFTVVTWSAENAAEWEEGAKLFLASGTALSDVSANPTVYTGEQSGETVCSSIDQLYGAYMDAEGDITNELTGYTCNTGSYVKVILRDRSR